MRSVLFSAASAVVLALAGASDAAAAAEPAPMPLEEAAKIFGTRPAVASMSLSPDGSKIAYVGAGAGRTSTVTVGDLKSGDFRIVTYSDGKPFDLKSCGWSAANRLVCTVYATDIAYGTKRVGLTRLLAVDDDGKNVKSLAEVSSRVGASSQLRISQNGGDVVDWLDGADGTVLISRDHVPEEVTGTVAAKQADGLGVDRVNTRTLAARTVERPRSNADEFISDGKGRVRIIALSRTGSSGQLTGQEDYLYRAANSDEWKPFSTFESNGEGMAPIAVDQALNAAYAVKKKEGRIALYRVALDGSMKTELVLDDPRVDVSGVEVLGRGSRVIGAWFVTDRKNVVYFDPAYRTLAAQLSRALPKTPLISFEDASTDENVLLIRASSDVDPGRFYLFRKSDHQLLQVMGARPDLDGRPLPEMRAITYKSFDGVDVPAYLTLPLGSSGKNLPTIVMPHGGPQSRDEWGFDFLVQFFASQGFAVLQPQFRGSTGYGEEWFAGNGWKSWKLAVGDVNAAGRWLVSQGIADPSKLAIFGWSYGGYAALQANVLDPDLFKAAVAVAPVTDLGMHRREFEGLTSETINKQFVGSGALLDEASPARHAGAFKAPVLMFHGTNDISVGVGESVAMNDALRRAGKPSELVRYPDLDHQLDDSQTRIDMLTKAELFLRKSLNM